MARIDRKLNLVIPVEADDGTTFYIHSTPIGRAIFEQYFLPIGKTFAAIFGEGLTVVSGPRIAMLMLRRVSEQLGEWDGKDGVRDGLVAEIHRLTNVVVPSPQGWKTVPYDAAVNEKIISADDASEVDNALAFFTCVSSIGNSAQISSVLGGMSALWGAQTTSSNCTDFASSLLTSTETGSSGATAPT